VFNALQNTAFNAALGIEGARQGDLNQALNAMMGLGQQGLTAGGQNIDLNAGLFSAMLNAAGQGAGLANTGAANQLGAAQGLFGAGQNINPVIANLIGSRTGTLTQPVQQNPLFNSLAAGGFSGIGNAVDVLFGPGGVFNRGGGVTVPGTSGPPSTLASIPAPQIPVQGPVGNPNDIFGDPLDIPGVTTSRGDTF
jgi:hypothetical protein